MLTKWKTSDKIINVREVITINKYEITEISNGRYIIQTYTKEFGLVYVLEKNTLNPKVFTKTEIIEYVTKWL